MQTSKLLKILVVASAIAGLAFGGYQFYQARFSSTALGDLALAKAEYDVKESADFWKLENQLKVDDKLYTIAYDSTLGASRDVAIKGKDSESVVWYRSVSDTLWSDFQRRHFEKFLVANPDFDYRQLDSLEGIGARLGVAHDPISLMQEIKTKEIVDTGLAIIFAILKLSMFFGVMIFAMIYAQGMANRNSIDKHNPKDIEDTLDDLVGLEDVKAELLQLEEMITHREKYADYGITKTFNVILTGPPGVGKTKIARCLSKRLNMPMFYASGASLETGYVGGGPKTLKRLVERASKLPRAIIFLDEAEGLLLSRDRPVNSRYENETMTTLLSMLDGVGSKNSAGIVWIVASNFDEHKISMDEAMLRRFHLKISFRLPNVVERKEILRRLISKRNQDVVAQDLELEHIATITSGMSPATLETLVSRAGLIAIQGNSPISQDIMLKAFERIAVGLTDRATTAKLDETRRVIAIHETGHFITQLHHALLDVEGDLDKLPHSLDVLKISTESVSKYGALGFVLSKNEDHPLNSRRQYEEKIIELYGGMANEELLLGEAEVTAGAHNDIERITNLLSMMFNEVGFYSAYKLNFRVMQGTGLDVGQQRFLEIKKQSAELYRDTMEILGRYRDLTHIMTDILMRNYVMTQSDFLPVIREFFMENPRMLAPYRPHVAKVTHQIQAPKASR